MRGGFEPERMFIGFLHRFASQLQLEGTASLVAAFRSGSEIFVPALAGGRGSKWISVPSPGCCSAAVRPCSLISCRICFW